MATLRQHIQSTVRQVTERHPQAWLVWCDPRGDWAPLLRAALPAVGIPLVEVEKRVTGQLGGPTDRARVQQQIDTKKPFMLRVAAGQEDLGWLWAQALRAEQIYSRTLRSQLTEWGWRPQVLHLSDEEVQALAEQNLDLDPSAWNSGGLEPNLDLLLSYLLLGTDIEGTQRVLLNLSAERTGLGQPDFHQPDRWRARSVAQLLVTDAHRQAAALIPERHELLIPPPARVLAHQLIDRWLDSKVYSSRQVLQRAIEAADPIAALDTLLGQADASVGPFLSRRAEQAVYAATCQHLARIEGRDLIELLAQLKPSIASHCSHTAIWVHPDSEGGSPIPWLELARLSNACNDLLAASPTAPWSSPQAALDWYITGGWRVDRSGEELLRNLTVPDPALVALLNPLRTAYRARWEQQLMAWSEVWQAAGCPQLPYPSAGEQLLKFLDARRPTAIIIVDALRYDLGHALAQSVNAQESAERAVVQPACAPLPSVTALGMAMALPITPADLVAESESGRWAMREQGQDLNLSLAASRRTWWTTRGHVAADAYLTTADVLNREVLKPTKSRPRLVVTDHTIDDQGHDGELEVAGAQEQLRRYGQVIQRLRDAGWLRIAVVTDHGYIHWSGQHDQRITPPAGDVVYSSRRAYAYRAGSVVSGAQAVSPGGRHPVVVPSGVACFAAYGKRGYFHGGASLQEWIIPVIEIDWPARARPVEVVLRDQPTILTQRPRITLLVPPVMFADEHLARDVKLVILHAETGDPLFTSEPQTIRPTDQPDATIDLMGSVRSGATAARGTSLTIEIRDAATGALLDSKPSRLMIELRQTDANEGW